MLTFDQLDVGKSYRLTERENPSRVRLLNQSTIALNETVIVRVLQFVWGGDVEVLVTSKSPRFTQTLPAKLINDGYLELDNA